MAMGRCEADLHYYDKEKHESCPYCQRLKGGKWSGHDLDEGEATDIISSATIKQDFDRKEPSASRSSTGVRINAEQVSRQSVRPASPVEAAAATVLSEAEPPPNLDAVTVMLAGEEKTFDPVVAWLVCMEGPERGKDHRIKAGINEIGREEDPEVDIVIKGDNTISRRYHAEIQYDPEDNIFYLIQKKNKALKINDAKVVRPTRLNPYDILQVGETRLVFVPLCSETFRWTMDQ